MTDLHAAAYGRIGQDPRLIPTHSGKTMAASSIAVSIGAHDTPAFWLNVVAFGQVADTLLRHEKGDLVSVSGRIQRNDYTTAAGEKREQLQIIADTIISARSVRPGGGKRRNGSKPPRAEARPSLNDDLPF